MKNKTRKKFSNAIQYNSKVSLVTAPQLEKLFGRQVNISLKKGLVRYLRIVIKLGKTSREHKEELLFDKVVPSVRQKIMDLWVMWWWICR